MKKWLYGFVVLLLAGGSIFILQRMIANEYKEVD